MIGRARRHLRLRSRRDEHGAGQFVATKKPGATYPSQAAFVPRSGDPMRKLLGTMLVATFVLAVGAAGRVMAAQSAAAGSLDDAQIAQRVLAFGRAEVQTANAVKTKLSSPPVWQLAQRMSVDDAALDQKFATLAAANQRSESAGAADGGVADG